MLPLPPYSLLNLLQYTYVLIFHHLSILFHLNEVVIEDILIVPSGRAIAPATARPSLCCVKRVFAAVLPVNKERRHSNQTYGLLSAASVSQPPGDYHPRYYFCLFGSFHSPP